MEKCILHPYAQKTPEDICWACEESKHTAYIEGYESYQKYIYSLEKEKEDRMEQVKRPKDDITWAVIEDLAARAAKGYIKYNTTLQENNHQNMLQHGYEEALDLAQYLKKEITTLNTIQDLVKQHSNDEELGRKVRELYSPKHG